MRSTLGSFVNTKTPQKMRTRQRLAEDHRMQQAHAALLWTAPLLLYAADAHAWGLYTHMFFAQVLIWAVPFADARFRRALRRFPELCLAATCLPDVSLFSTPMRAAALRATHQWSAALGMLRDASVDEERAMAAGYASHLLTDIIAHNYFVPAHQRMWFRAAMLTHATCEWAMDAHVSDHVFVRPAALINAHRDTLARYAAQRLGCDLHVARRALGYLMRGERALRGLRLPQLVYRASRCVDHGAPARFDQYIRETSSRLLQVNRLIAGEVPRWLPELESSRDFASGSQQDRTRSYYALLLPVDFFRDGTGLNGVSDVVAVKRA